MRKNKYWNRHRYYERERNHVEKPFWIITWHEKEKENESVNVRIRIWWGLPFMILN